MMKKKLPEIFQNTIEKNLKNNEDVYYSGNEEIPKNKNIVKKNNIREQINKIFSSPNYVYKANVKISTNDKTFTTRIIGRNKNYLITMDNKTILIDSIKNIEIE